MIMKSYDSNSNYCDRIIPIHEVEKSISLKPLKIKQNIEILNRKGIVSEIDEENGIPTCGLLKDNTDWSIWSDIIIFSEKTGVSIEEIFYNLNFSVFDE